LIAGSTDAVPATVLLHIQQNFPPLRARMRNSLFIKK
jgi:hypothetical protein